MHIKELPNQTKQYIQYKIGWRFTFKTTWVEITIVIETIANNDDYQITEVYVITPEYKSNQMIFETLPVRLNSIVKNMDYTRGILNFIQTTIHDTYDIFLDLNHIQ